MYERVLDEERLAGQIVDSIRDITGAPLNSCVEAAKVVVASIGEFIKDDAFSRINRAVSNFEVNIENCRDMQMIRLVGEKLNEMFKEKEELSYSTTQDNMVVVEYMRVFRDIVDNTDPRIPMAFLKGTDFQWLGALVRLYLEDQNGKVKMSALKTIDSIAGKCHEVIPFLMDSSLPVNLIMQMPDEARPLDDDELRQINLLSKIFSTDIQPPLSHFDMFDSTAFIKLFALLEFHPDAVLEFCINFNHNVPWSIENPVVAALRIKSTTAFGEIFTKYFNKNCTEKALELLANILKSGNDLLGMLFYDNDFPVLCRVLGRELMNSEKEEVREKCLDVIELLVKAEKRHESLIEAVELCSISDEKKDRVLEVLKTV